MVSTDQGFIIAWFVISVLTFAGLLSAVVILWRQYEATDAKWRKWLLENPDKQPVAANRWIPLMNRAQIQQQGEMLDTADPATSG